MKRGMIKLLLSIFATACASVSLVASTFAYVLINNKVIVPDFDFNIKGQEGLEISLDNKNWSQDILANSIKEKIFNENKDYYDSNNIHSFDEIKFSCTSIDQSLNGNDYVIVKDNNNQVKFHYDDLTNEAINDVRVYKHVDTPAGANENNGYIKFDLYLKSRSTYEAKKNFTLKMNNDTNITSVTEEGSNLNKVRISNKLTTREYIEENGNITYLDTYKEYEPGDYVYVDISNAIRLGVYNVDQDENNNFTKYNNFNIYEMTNKYDLGSACLELADYTGKDKYNPDLNAMYTYYNNYFVKYPLNPGGKDGEAFKTKTKEELLADEFGKFEFNNTNNDYNVIKLEIYIWLEGWDADYFVGIPEKTKIRVDLGFEII